MLVSFFNKERTMDFLYCVQMYLPVKDRNGCPIDTKKFNQVAKQIVKKIWWTHDDLVLGQSCIRWILEVSED